MTHSRPRWRQARRSVRRPKTVGQAPGTLIGDPDAPPPRVHVIAYGPDKLIEESITNLDRIAELRRQAPCIWVDIEGTLHIPTIQKLGQLFGLHPLAIEDTVNTHQRAKVENYGETLFIVTRMMLPDPLVAEQVSLFLGPGFVLTFQENIEGDVLEPVRNRLRRSHGRLRGTAVGYLAYELIDAIIDSYFPLMERYEQVLTRLDEEVAHRPPSEILGQLHAIRQDLLFLRRILWPHRDVMSTLSHIESPLIDAETKLYFRDCHDHVVQLMEILELYRESGSDLRDFSYSRLEYRANEIMRILTVIATIFMPLSFIASVYGMNFEHMPELKWEYGYPLALFLMSVVASSFLVFVYRKGWLQPGEQPRRVGSIEHEPESPFGDHRPRLSVVPPHHQASAQLARHQSPPQAPATGVATPAQAGRATNGSHPSGTAEHPAGTRHA